MYIDLWTLLLLSGRNLTGQDGGKRDFDYDFMMEEIENIRKKFLREKWKSNLKKTELKKVRHEERKKNKVKSKYYNISFLICL